MKVNLKPKDTVYFKFNDNEILEGVVDEVTETKITMHCPPKNKHWHVYTARIFEFKLNEYGMKFAATKEELK